MKVPKTIKQNKMCTKKILVFTTLLLLFIFQSCYFDNKEDLYQFADTVCDFTQVSYTNDVSPVLTQYCMSCHSESTKFGNVSLEGHNNVKIYANNGSLYGAVAHTGNYSIMPPSGQKIPPCDIDKLKAWIDAGSLNN